MILPLIGLAALCSAGAVQAAESTPSVTRRATVTLISDTDTVQAGTPYHVGLRFRLAPGWHTYGRNPGDAGVPAELNWTLPAGTSIGDIAWPTPKRLAEGTLMTYAYTGEVLLAQTVSGPGNGPGSLRLHASWLVCNDICVPEEADFNLDLAAGTPAASAEATLFTLAARALPRTSPFQVRISPDGALRVSGNGLTGVRSAWFVPDEANVIAASGPQSLRARGDGLVLAMTPAEGFKPGATMSGVLVLDDASGVETSLSVQAQPGAVEVVTPLWQAIGFALLGGLILNLMPCVFPVLAMKAYGIAKLAHGHRRAARLQAGFYTLGVLTTFAVIGLGLVALRQFGHAVGWGFQFQSPVFVAGMAWVLFTVGLNMSGVFAIHTQATDMGQNLTLRGGWIGSFASGALAVLVATPCTAPFMGVALAAALVAPPLETLVVFLAMGLGLAAPTALLALVPALGRSLPRPGAWMEILRQALAFPMYAAAAWLVWVLSLQAGPSGVLVVAAGMVLIGFAVWALRLGRVGKGFAVAAVVGILALLPTIGVAPTVETSAESYTPARLAGLRAEGKPVFVNMTAAWCVTCLVNEHVALSTAPVRQAFAAQGITLLKGDWTRQDPEISRFLQAQGRDGVPLYLFYPANNRPPVVLPQILTESTVLDAIKGS